MSILSMKVTIMLPHWEHEPRYMGLPPRLMSAFDVSNRQEEKQNNTTCHMMNPSMVNWQMSFRKMNCGWMNSIRRLRIWNDQISS